MVNQVKKKKKKLKLEKICIIERYLTKMSQKFQVRSIIDQKINSFSENSPSIMRYDNVFLTL